MFSLDLHLSKGQVSIATGNLEFHVSQTAVVQCVCVQDIFVRLEEHSIF